MKYRAIAMLTGELIGLGMALLMTFCGGLR